MNLSNNNKTPEELIKDRISGFENVTVFKFMELLKRPTSEDSPFQFQEKIDHNVLDKIPLFLLLENYLKIVLRDGSIRLTPLGALPKKIITELYGKRILLHNHIEQGIVKLSREQDCISIMSMRLTAQLAGLVRKTNGKLYLTKKTTQLIARNERQELFTLFFEAFANKFNFAYNDGYTDEPVGQEGWAITMYLLNYYGKEPRLVSFYAEKYMKVFPLFIDLFPPDHYTTSENKLARCYHIRVFDRFLVWFGLLDIDEREKGFIDGNLNHYKQSDIFPQVFKFD